MYGDYFGQVYLICILVKGNAKNQLMVVDLSLLRKNSIQIPNGQLHYLLTKTSGKKSHSLMTN